MNLQKTEFRGHHRYAKNTKQVRAIRTDGRILVHEQGAKNVYQKKTRYIKHTNENAIQIINIMITSRSHTRMQHVHAILDNI